MENGNSYAYLITEATQAKDGGTAMAEDVVFKVDCAANETVVLLEPGDLFKVSPEGDPEQSLEPGAVYETRGFALE